MDHEEIEFIEITWTSGSIDEARKISRLLVQERHVAQAQIIPWIESISLLDNQLETSQESKIILKARMDSFEVIKEFIEKHSKYEIPEITWSKIEGGNRNFMEWLVASQN